MEPRPSCRTTCTPLIPLGLVFGALLCAVQGLALERPKAGEIALLRTADKLAPRLDFARRLGNHRLDAVRLRSRITQLRRLQLVKEGKTEAEALALAPQPAPPPAWRGMPTTGSLKVLALLIEFQDQAASMSRDDIHRNLFGTGVASNSPYESLAAYYQRSSYGQLDLSHGETLGWYKHPANRPADPGDWPGRMAIVGSLIKDAVRFHDQGGHDFSQYDNDDDGVIDYLIVIWAGPSGDWATLWWGWQFGFPDASFVVDGKTLGRFSWQWTASSPQVVIHETGHALGIPDYYDYDESVGPSGGVGGMDMMDANRYDHNALSKWMLEWIGPADPGPPSIVGDGPRSLTLAPAASSPASMVAVWPGMAANPFTEFFLVQNRQRVGNDSQLPADGLLIWHVNARLDASGYDFEFDNSFTAEKLLRLVEADGGNHIDSGAWAGSSDMFQTGRAFGPETTPNSNTYDGTRTNVSVRNITASGSSLSAVFSAAASPGVLRQRTPGHGPNDRLGKGAQWDLVATLRGPNGAATPGATVHFSVDRLDLLRISSPSGVTGANGETKIQLTGKTGSKSQAVVTAEAAGAPASKIVIKVPVFPPALALAVAAAMAFRASRVGPRRR